MFTNNERINKMWFICTIKDYLALNREVLTHSTIWMNFENIILSEVSQA